jgi:RNA polymerase sigma-70 factor, ECF subfamily
MRGGRLEGPLSFLSLAAAPTLRPLCVLADTMRVAYPTQEPTVNARVGPVDRLPRGVSGSFPLVQLRHGWGRLVLDIGSDLMPSGRKLSLAPRRSRRLTPGLRSEILATVPRLRAFAVSLTASSDRADDLVQETMVRALSHIEQFQPGTNLRAWLFTILRNQFNSEYRQRRWLVEDADGIYVGSLKTIAQQSSWLEFQELRAALTKLPPEQREAVILVGAAGMSYEEAAMICGCAIGTIKSRVNRGRAKLAQLLTIERADDFGPDQESRAVMAAGG